METGIARDIGVVTSEIKELQSRAANTMLSYAVEIGRRLTEAKAMLSHGEWGRWLEEEVDFSQRSATNMMRLYDEYGTEQTSFFPEFAKSQTFANLSYSKALALLAVPAEEREEFAEKVDAEHIPVAELQQAIKEKKLAEAEAEEAKARAEELRLRAEQAENAAEEQRRRAETVTGMEQRLKELEGELTAAKEKEKKLKAKLKEAKDNPTISPEKVAEIEADAARAAKLAAQAEAETDVEKLKAELEAAKTAAKEADEKASAAAAKLAETEKKLKMANPAVLNFKQLFEQLQDTANKCRRIIAEVEATDEETATRFKRALAALGEKLKEIEQ